MQTAPQLYAIKWLFAKCDGRNFFCWTINLLHFNVTFDSVDEQNKQQPTKKTATGSINRDYITEPV